MKTTYRPSLKAHVSVDDNEQVKHIRHSQEYWFSEEAAPRPIAAEYLQQWSEVYQIPEAQLKNLHQKVSHFDPREQDIEYQFAEDKHLFDGHTVAYAQTFLNVPVWRKGFAVKIKQNPYRVVGSTNNSENGLKGKLPDLKHIERYKQLFRTMSVMKLAGNDVVNEDAASEADIFMMKALGKAAPKTPVKKNATAAATERTRYLNGRFFAYKYDVEKRYGGKPAPPKKRTDNSAVSEEFHEHNFPQLPAVDESINNGQTYLVAEIIFEQYEADHGSITWLILVEVATNSILYIECMTCGVNGLVFKQDPMVSSGDLTVVASSTGATLAMHDSSQPLNNLAAPVAGTQSLSGTYVVIQDVESPSVTPPTKPSGTDFDYSPRTNDFAAVNAYYHETELFRTIESLGFPIATYFDGTTFPIPVDHRGMGTTINAHWSPNGSGGTGHMCFALCDLSDTTNPLGRAVDPWVHWHEMGGHGTLGDHVNSGLLGFAHSAGDGLAAIQMDPESALRTLPERFKYAPFRPIPAGSYERRFDRPVATWAWDGPTVYDGSGALVSGDDNGYGSEQILATCHFQIYRSIGGDHSNVGRRKFASRAATYLILRTIGNLTPGTNPGNAQQWCEEMQDADLENWTSEGISGGAYNKVIRWAFEKQGCYQPAGTLPPITTAGAPPQVDVYINDGRNGEYQFQAVHWGNMSMWNRNNPDGMPGHEDALPGVTNYMYGKVKNRGTQAATNVNVRAFHSLPGAGLTWPNDFTEMPAAPGLPIASIAANNAAEITVGPFEWIPNVNAYGHDCVLMIVSAPGDPSNIDNFTGGETIEEWRLVPNDNNVGQRNVNILPGGGGENGLMLGLNRHIFYAGNSFRKRATMELKTELPKFLSDAGWKIAFEGISGNKFVLKPGEKREIVINLIPGKDFTADQVRNAENKDITVELLGNDISLGGMVYRLDPDKKVPGYIPGGTKGDNKCNDKAQELLKCLHLGDAEVKKVCVKKISLDIELNNDCKC
ncbi:MAG: hypothetical protein J7621_16910 [Niastella sp.]|nr:hypothetical protein [Niastella sp.]